MTNVDRIEAAAKEMLSYHFDDEPVNGCKPCILAGHTLRLVAVARAAEAVSNAEVQESWPQHRAALDRLWVALAALNQEPKHV